MKLFEAMASAIADEGTTDVFGLMGDGNINFWGALAQQGRTKIYSARNEAGAVAMADGYFRATGKTGFATITCGPGLTQVGTSLVAAARNRSAMVVLIGQIPAGDRYNLQVFDQRRFVEACEAHYVPIRKLDFAADDIAEAFYAAQANRCPVVIDAPNDLQLEDIDWEWDYRPTFPFRLSPQAARDSDVADLCEKFVEADRPVIIAGRGARNPEAHVVLRRLGDLTGSLLATTFQAKGLFQGERYDVGIAGSYASAPAEELFTEADFVLGIGAELGYHTSEGGLLFPSAQVARIDIAPLRKLGQLPGLYVQGDAVKTLNGLVDMLERRAHQANGFRTSETDAVLNQPRHAYPRAKDGLDPRILLRELSYAIPQHARVTCGGGHFMGFVAMHLPLPASADFQVSLQFAAVGQTVPVAIGMGVGDPGRAHLVIEGDGSLMMNVQELETIARHRIPTVVIVLNDSGFGAEVHKLRLKGFDPGIAQWTSPDFVALSRSLGGDGVKLGSEQEIGEAVRRGLAAGGLFLIDAPISPTEVSDAYRKIHMGIPNHAPLVRYEPAPKDFL
jgi:thiamine pyrophosphate-dependent acetolactate synthase large subunit-like protein